MIKGTSRERIEYCKFIENYKYEIDSPFQSINRFCRIVHRYYLMRMKKNNLSRFEVSAANLVSLTYIYTTRILDLVYIWIYNEGLPLIIDKITPQHPKYYISATEITELIWDCPKSVLSSMLLKAELNSSIIEQCIDSYENLNKDSLKQLIKENIPAEVAFTTFQIIDFTNQVFQAFKELDVKDEMNGNVLFVNSLKDTLEIIYDKEEINIELLPYFEDKNKKMEEYFLLFLEKIHSSNVDAVESLLKWSLIIIKIIPQLFASFFGNEDPIVKEMNKLVSDKIFMRTDEMYSLKEYEKEYYKQRFIKIINYLNIPDKVSEEKIINNSINLILPSKSASHHRIEFPTRISKNKPMDLKVKKQILSGLYNEFGSYLENFEGDPITEEEFRYLFSGPVSRPQNYKTPYYWNQTIPQFAALLRLLYFEHPTGKVDYTILLVKDKGKEKSSVKWSTRKSGLGKPILKPIEEKIQNIVFEVTGRHLPEVDLTKQNKSKKKEDKK